MATTKPSDTMEINSQFDSNDNAVKSPNCHCKLTAVHNELKLIIAEVNVITKWIERKFGTAIVNKNSDLFNERVYKSQEIDSLSESLTLPYDLGILEAPIKTLYNKKSTSNKGKGKRATNQIVAKSTGKEILCDITTEKAQKYPRKTGKIKAYALDKEATDKMGNAVQNNKNLSSNTKINSIADNLEKEIDPIYKETSPRKKIKVKSNHKIVTQSDVQTQGIVNEAINPAKLKSTEKTSNRGQGKNVDWRKYACSGPKQCDECGKVVMGTSSLKQHKRMHADERPFECLECKQKFRYRKNLKIHMIALHNGERHLQCSFCGKKFYAPKDLKIHERTHTGLKPYACHLCPKRFNIKEHLTMHIRVHTGERPYKCQICDKAFSQANSLRIHKKIHEKIVQDKPQKRKAKSTVELLSTDGNVKCPTTENLLSHIHPASMSTFQLMVPTMQTVTAAIVSVSTVTSPFPCINLSHPQTGNENTLGSANYTPVIGSLENSSQTNEQNNPPLVTPSSVLVGNISKTVAIPNSEKINVQMPSVSTAALGNLALTSVNINNEKDPNPNRIHQNLN